MAANLNKKSQTTNIKANYLQHLLIVDIDEAVNEDYGYDYQEENDGKGNEGHDGSPDSTPVAIT